MKKLFLLFFGICTVFLLNAQNLPNVGFENWGTEFLYEGLDQWNNSNSQGLPDMLGISKSTDAYTGEYSVKLQSTLDGEDSVLNFIYLGTVTEGPSGGIAYTEEFDQVKGFYKCNMPEEDSASIYTIKWYGNTPSEVISKVGGVNETWTEFTIDVVGGTCDSVFIGFISSDVMIETNIEFDSWVMFDSIYFNNTLGDNPSLIPNNDMEDWVDYEALELTDWYTVNGFVYSMGLESVSQSEDSYSGTYSARLEAHLFYDHIIPGYLSIGEITFDDEDPMLGVAYEYQPTYLTGYYKYMPEGEDNAFIMLEMRASDAIVGGNSQSLAAVSEWTYFEMPINCGGVPDEMELIFHTGSNANSVLFLDEVNFEFSFSVENVKSDEISIYPNPASDYIFVSRDENSGGSVNVFDLQGRLVITSELNDTASKIDISELDSGLYFVSTDGNSNRLVKLIVK